ncbi:facilitated trehalose transporter Tret1 [Amyelois transitella]|uniref:facilitated trehalose transporter Tret1 n=1 Tax=Amyelois transitella TaxID=680683 RepID=UPI00067E33FA|nr:facilitated trehalose transporter Tret1 [Amyelois transitella]
MESKNRRISPFAIQCFVSAGVTFNMAGMGLVMGFVTGLLPQLRRPDSIIQIDDTTGSWIASLPGFTIIVGNFIAPSIMGKFGRRTANLCSLAVSVTGWLCIVFSNTVTILLLARFIQGIAMGMIGALGPILIGEYTSPKNRGLFLMSISVNISLGIFTIQALGAFLYWKTCALICIGIVLLTVLLVILSPESPTFLADKERYDECRKVFNYLRGDTENEELEKMIAAKMLLKKEQIIKTDMMKEMLLSKFDYFKKTSKKKEFFKPLLIMFHIFIMAQWCGVNILTSFTTNLFEKVVGLDAGINIPLMIVLVGLHRVLGNIVGMVFIKTLRRRVVLFTTISLNVVALFAIAAYTYARDNNYLPFDEPAVGIILVHIHMFSVATGAIPLAFVLAGELFPMEYKSLCGGISMIFYSLSLFSNMKTVLLLFNTWGISGTYCLYAGVVVYCLVVVGVLLPETKDKTLLDIEEGFRGKKLSSS